MRWTPVLLATRSEGKLKELRPALAAAGYGIVDLAHLGVPVLAEEELLERFATYEENALAKARFFHELTGLLTVADDSGIEVAGLGWAPGVQSKRWSRTSGLSRGVLDGLLLDAANNARLVSEVRGLADRRARYVCAAACYGNGVELVVRGTAEGSIVLEGRGSGGFGYDPYFLSEELGRTFAEVSAEDKWAVSHRGRAIRLLVEELAKWR
jgi:XTP/dITP diphosphohydrolase